MTYGGLTSSLTVIFDVKPVAEFTISGPLDGRVSLKPGETVDVSLDLSNTGTMDLLLSLHQYLACQRAQGLLSLILK